MTNSRRSPATRALALLLAVMMFAGLFAFSASAANATNVKQYGFYSCIGDSIAAGYGRYARDTRGFVTVPEAYHSLVANATGAGVQSLAHTGMRTVEVRWLLNDEYSSSQESRDLRAMYFNGLHDELYWMDMMKKNPNDPDLARYADPDSEYYIRPNIREVLAPYCNEGAYGFKTFYRNTLKNSDLVTIELGVNDVFLYAMKETARELDNLNLITEVTEFLRYMNVGNTQFRVNFPEIIKGIKELNPNVTIVVVGMFNPFSKVVLSERTSSWAQVGKIADVMVSQLNTYMKQQASTLGYLYADVIDTEIEDTVPFTDPTFYDEIVKDAHPTAEGHKYMANQIIGVLPERGSVDPAPAPSGLPFTDVKTNDWFYNDVVYCYDNKIMDGMTDTTFEPQGTTTRAQFATVLYRMANRPDVSGLTSPFKDVPSGTWFSDAIVWGYNTGVINGVSETEFAPNARVTREQMVTMLHRYAGLPKTKGDLSMFSDAGSISDYAKQAVAWAVEKGIVNGMDNNLFVPQGFATRAQLAKVLHVYQTTK